MVVGRDEVREKAVSMMSATQRLKDGAELLVREAVPDDAESLLAYVHRASGESDMLTFGPGEFELSVEQERAFLESVQRDPRQVYLVGLLGDEIVSSANVTAGSRRRVQHVGELGISVAKAAWNRGVGTVMVEALLVWSRAAGISKMNLQVRTDNAAAIRLYQKCGFEIEGTLRDALRVGGQDYDVFCMGRRL